MSSEEIMVAAQALGVVASALFVIFMLLGRCEK